MLQLIGAADATLQVGYALPCNACRMLLQAPVACLQPAIAMSRLYETVRLPLQGVLGQWDSSHADISDNHVVRGSCGGTH